MGFNTSVFDSRGISTSSRPRKDLTGRRFGHLKVLNYAFTKRRSEGKNGSVSRIYYRCKCDCGRYTIVLGGNLSKGNSTSCRCNWSNRTYEEITGAFFGQIQRSAAVRGMSFRLTPQYLWELFLKQERRCALTGWNLVMPKHKVKGTASLDRIDSSKGYTKDNVQWLHKDVNIAKQDTKEDQFIFMCTAIARKRGTISASTPLRFC